MEYLPQITSILLIHILAWLTPGPLIALIIRNSLVYSRKVGLMTAIGFAMGNFIHIGFAVLGMGVLISTSTVSYNLIKFIGIGYLIYLGVKTFLSKSHVQSIKVKEKHKDISSFSAVKIGLFTNLLSPQAYAFFGAIFSSLLTSKSSLGLISLLIVVMPINTFIMASLWSLFFTQRPVQTLYSKYESVLNKVLGGLLIIFALMNVFSTK